MSSISLYILTDVLFLFQDLELSSELHYILARMCEEQSDLRLSLTEVLHRCSQYSASHSTQSFSAHVMKMYELVFGSCGNVSTRYPSYHVTVSTRYPSYHVTVSTRYPSYHVSVTNMNCSKFKSGSMYLQAWQHV